MGNKSERSSEEHEIVAQGSELLVGPDVSNFDELIRLLSDRPQFVERDDYLADMDKRQTAVDRHLLAGGSDTLRKFFERVKQLEKHRKQPLNLDLSMLSMQGKILSGLYLPGANLEKLVITDSDIGGSDLQGANLRQVVAVRAKAAGIVATAANWTDAVAPLIDFSGSRLIGNVFINTHLEDMVVKEDTNFCGSLFINVHWGNADMSIPNTAGCQFINSGR